MAYTPTSWADRNVQYPNRYTLTNISGSTYDIVAAPGTVTNAGTAVTAARMNNVEAGLDDTESRLVTVEGKYLDKTILNSAGDIIYATANDTPANLSIGTAGYVLTSRSSAPAWEVPPVWTVIAGNTVRLSLNTERTTTTTSGYGQALKDCKPLYRGTMTFKFEAKASSGIGIAYVRQYINGAYVNLADTGASPINTSTYTNYSLNAYCLPYDTRNILGAELWILSGSGGTIYVRNLTICYDFSEATLTGTD